MPRNGRKDGRRSRNREFNEHLHSYDITLNDYANTLTGGGRVKKSTNSFVRKDISEKDSRDWFEKDIQEFTIGDDQEEEEVQKPIKTQKKLVKIDSALPDNQRVYPKDIWYILSKYISPEYVGKFAVICSDSNEVVNSASFWHKLYKRYYKPDIVLPYRLQRECLERPRGLKPSVIRALFRFYGPFCNRLKQQHSCVNDSDQAHTLIKSTCVLMWNLPDDSKKLWHFVFKLQKNVVISKDPSTSKQMGQPDLLEMLGDMDYNPDNNCAALQVSCANYMIMPPVMGMLLSNVKIGLNQDSRNHRVHLTFIPYANCRSSITITLDPVVVLKVYDWWHPSYPLNSDNHLECLLNNSSESSNF